MSKQIIEFPILKQKDKTYVLTPTRSGAFSLEGITPNQEVNEIIMGIIKAYKKGDGPKTYKELEDEVMKALQEKLNNPTPIELSIYEEQVRQILPFVHGVFYNEEIPMYAKLRIRQRLIEMQNNTSLVRTSIDSELKKYFEVNYEKDQRLGLDRKSVTTKKDGEYVLPKISNGQFVISQDAHANHVYSWDTVALVRVSKKTWDGFFKMLEDKVKGTELEEQVAQLKEELKPEKAAVLLEASGKDAPGLNESILSRLRSIFTRDSFPQPKKDPQPRTRVIVKDNGGVGEIQTEDQTKPEEKIETVKRQEIVQPVETKLPEEVEQPEETEQVEEVEQPDGAPYTLSYKYKGTQYTVELDEDFNVLNKGGAGDGRTLIDFDNAYDYYDNMTSRYSAGNIDSADEVRAHIEITDGLDSLNFAPRTSIADMEETEETEKTPDETIEPEDTEKVAPIITRRPVETPSEDEREEVREEVHDDEPQANPYNSDRPYSRIRKKGRLQRFFLFFAHHWVPMLAISAIAIVGGLAIAGIFPGAIPAAAAVFSFFSTGLSLYWPAFAAVGLAIVGVGEILRRKVFKNRKRRRLEENKVLNNRNGLKTKLDKNIRSMKRVQKQILMRQQMNDDILSTSKYDRSTGKQVLSRQQSKRYNNNIRKINKLFDELHKYSRKASNNVEDIDTHLAKEAEREQRILGSDKGPGIKDEEQLSEMGVKASILTEHEPTLREMIVQNRQLKERAEQSAKKAEEMGVTTSGRVAKNYFESIHQANQDIESPLTGFGISVTKQVDGLQDYTDPVSNEDTEYKPLGKRMIEAHREAADRRREAREAEARERLEEAARLAAAAETETETAEYTETPRHMGR